MNKYIDLCILYMLYILFGMRYNTWIITTVKKQTAQWCPIAELINNNR